MKLWLFNIMISMTGLSEVICKNHIYKGHSKNPSPRRAPL